MILRSCRVMTFNACSLKKPHQPCISMTRTAVDVGMAISTDPVEFERDLKKQLKSLTEWALSEGVVLFLSYNAGPNELLYLPTPVVMGFLVTPNCLFRCVTTEKFTNLSGGRC